MSCAARSVCTLQSPTTPVAAGIAESAKEPQRRSGSPSAKRNCCRCCTSTRCSRCRIPWIADIAYQNKAAIYDLLFKASSETMLTIAADRKHLGARIGILSVLHTWGSALNHHPHIHIIVRGGGSRPRWQALGLLSAPLPFPRKGSLLLVSPVTTGRSSRPRTPLANYSSSANTPNSLIAKPSPPICAHCATAIGSSIARTRSEAPKKSCAISPAIPIASPSQHRRLIAFDDKGVTFKWEDYRVEGAARYKVMTLATDEFIRRFLMHVLPAGFHRIRYSGLLASGKRAQNIARARKLLTPPMIPIDTIKAMSSDPSAQTAESQVEKYPCPRCGAPMIIIERFERGCQPKHRPSPPATIRIDTS